MRKQENRDFITLKLSKLWLIFVVTVVFGYTVGKDLAIKHKKQDKQYEQEIEK